MTQDELIEIHGIKPNVVLADGEEREVGSTTSKTKYKVKRTSDHYHCSCPAWRNQAGVPVNARTCKHLKSFLGDAYENARTALKSSDGPPPNRPKDKVKGPTKTTPSRVKPTLKRKWTNEDNPDEGQNEVGATKSERVPKRPKSDPEDAKMQPAGDVISHDDSADELAKIHGIKPLVVMLNGEEREIGSATSKNKYKIKRTFDHYYCSCPAWRNQARVPVNTRTCKHLKALLGDAYEEARLKFKSSGPSHDSQVKPEKLTPNAKPTYQGKKEETREVDMSEGKDDNDREAHDQGEGGEVQADPLGQDGSTAEAHPEVQISDELAEIDGIKPNVYLKDGAETEVGSLTSTSKYKVKRTWDHYYCSCPAWRNQGGSPVNARTCKHLKLLLGEAYESARVRWKNPSGPQPKASAAGKKTKGKGKSNQTAEDEEDGVSGKSAPALLLANKWDLDDGPDPTGWWVSEKLDGVRTYFDGKQMLSRLGNPFTPPQWFLDKLPKDITLDGELFGGRGEFQATVSIVKTVNSPHWKNITFQVFDVPSLGSSPFEDRMARLQQLFGPGGSYASEHVIVVAHEEARSREHVIEKLKEVENLGGEGLMLRQPKSMYEGHRSSTLFKIKTFYDAEAIVTGYAGGKGKHKGLTGALQCRMESGKTFSVGSGLNDKQRKNPPKIGSIIVYRFQELTRDRVPRFPTFVGVAADKDKPKDAEIPERKLIGGAEKGPEE